MSDGQNDIACLDILTKYIKLMDLQGTWHQYVYCSVKKPFFFEGKSYQTRRIYRP